MAASPPLYSQIAAVLDTADEDDADVLDRLVPLVYEQLRAMAHRQLAREHGARTLQTTALVHEAYLKVADDSGVAHRGRSYFFAAAARAMRQVLVDRARRRAAQKRGGGAERVTLDDGAAVADGFVAEVLDLDRALTALAERNARHARVVECRFFGGLSIDETAAALGVSPRTVRYDLALAKAWLYEALHSSAAPGEAAR